MTDIHLHDPQTLYLSIHGVPKGKNHAVVPFGGQQSQFGQRILQGAQQA